jgi:hypothetical protein
MSFVQPENDEKRARIIKKLNKRTYFILDKVSLKGADQYINGYNRQEYCLLELDKDGTVKLAFLKTPFHSVYGPQVMAKRRPNGRYWYISNAYADTLDKWYIDAMEAVADGTHTFPEFDANDLDRIV